MKKSRVFLKKKIGKSGSIIKTVIKTYEVNCYIKRAKELGATHIFLILPEDLIFNEKALLSCYNCRNYGKKMTCPPHIPQVSYKKLILSYKKCLLVCMRSDFQNKREFNKARKDSSNRLLELLLDLEKVAFAQGNYFAISFAGGSCRLCNTCPVLCKYPEKARIPIEALGIDVVATLKRLELKLRFPVRKYFYRVGLFLMD